MNLRILGWSALVIVLLLGLLLWVKFFSNNMFTTNYGAKPSNEAFEQVFGFPLPHGISSIVIAGHQGVSASMVFMKITANEKVIRTITQDLPKIDESKFKYQMPDTTHGLLQVYYNDALTAGWEEVPNLPDKSIYIFRNKKNTDIWGGTIVVCNKTKTIYVSAVQ